MFVCFVSLVWCSTALFCVGCLQPLFVVGNKFFRIVYIFSVMRSPLVLNSPEIHVVIFQAMKILKIKCWQCKLMKGPECCLVSL